MKRPDELRPHTDSVDVWIVEERGWTFKWFCLDPTDTVETKRSRTSVVDTVGLRILFSESGSQDDHLPSVFLQRRMSRPHSDINADVVSYPLKTVRKRLPGRRRDDTSTYVARKPRRGEDVVGRRGHKRNRNKTSKYFRNTIPSTSLFLSPLAHDIKTVV